MAVRAVIRFRADEAASADRVGCPIIHPGARPDHSEAPDGWRFGWPLGSALTAHVALAWLILFGLPEAPLPSAGEQGIPVTIAFVTASPAGPSTPQAEQAPDTTPDSAHPEAAAPATAETQAVQAPAPDANPPVVTADATTDHPQLPADPTPPPSRAEVDNPVHTAPSPPKAAAARHPHPKVASAAPTTRETTQHDTTGHATIDHAAAASGTQPAPVSGPASASAQVAATQSGQPDGAWEHAVMLWLQAHRTYPPAAQRRGEQGAALVRLTVGRDGRVRTFTLMQSTGSPRLDAAVETLFGNAELPPFPPSMTQPQAVIDVPIRYRLES